jgi:hypothetical protein
MRVRFAFTSQTVEFKKSEPIQEDRSGSKTRKEQHAVTLIAVFRFRCGEGFGEIRTRFNQIQQIPTSAMKVSS